MGQPSTPDGWLDYLDPNQNIFNVLGQWSTDALGLPDKNDKWELRLELADASFTGLGTTIWHNIQLDNEAPVAKINMTAGGTLADCNDFDQGVPVTGVFVARDPQGHFGFWTLDTTPDSLNPKDPVADPVGLLNSDATSASGYGFKMDTTSNSLGTPLQPCGYVITVRAWDNTVVHSFPGIHNSSTDDTGFCLRKPT